MEETKNSFAKYKEYIIYHNPTIDHYWVLKDNILIVQIQESNSPDYYINNPFADEKIDDINFSDYSKFKSIVETLEFKDIDPPPCTYIKQKYDEFTSYSFQVGPDHKLKYTDVAKNTNYIIIKHCDKYCSNDYTEFDKPFVSITMVKNGQMYIAIYPLHLFLEEKFDPEINYSVTIFNCIHPSLLRQLNWLFDPILFHVKRNKSLCQITVKEVELTDKWYMLIHKNYHQGIYEFIHITFENH